MPRQPQPSDPFYACFAGTAGRAAVFELTARMFVDAVPELSGSLTSKLDPLMKDLTAWMERETKTIPDERELLWRCARLRNKLFHAELSRATGQLVSLGVELGKEGVRRFSWPGELTPEIFHKVMQEGGEPVGKTKTTEGRLFGWLLEAQQTGMLGAAASTFDDGADLLHRVLEEWVHENMRRDAKAASDRETVV